VAPVAVRLTELPIQMDAGEGVMTRLMDVATVTVIVVVPVQPLAPVPVIV